MPQIAQQDYKVIAPKLGREFFADAAALGELKKSILNGIGFDCLLKDTLAADSGTLDRLLSFYEDGSYVMYVNVSDSEIKFSDLPYTVTQYQGLAAVQNAEDEWNEAPVTSLPQLSAIRTGSGSLVLGESEEGLNICVGGKYLTVTGDATIEALTIAETGPAEGFINITWEDAQKLIGLPLA